MLFTKLKISTLTGSSQNKNLENFYKHLLNFDIMSIIFFVIFIIINSIFNSLYHNFLLTYSFILFQSAELSSHIKHLLFGQHDHCFLTLRSLHEFNIFVSIWHLFEILICFLNNKSWNWIIKLNWDLNLKIVKDFLLSPTWFLGIINININTEKLSYQFSIISLNWRWAPINSAQIKVSFICSFIYKLQLSCEQIIFDGIWHFFLWEFLYNCMIETSIFQS